MIKKLTVKFIAINMILISIVLLVTFFMFYISTQQRLARESTSILQRTIMDANRSEPFRREIGPSTSKSGFMPVPTFTVTLDAQNRITATNGVLFDLTDEQALSDIVAVSLQSDSDMGIIDDAKLRYLKQSSPSGMYIAFVDRTVEIDTLSSLIWTSFLVGMGSLAAFFLISLYLAKWALRPVEKAWEQQKQFVADASHELKTPLTVILANASFLQSKEQSVRDQSKWIQYIKDEAVRMRTLVENLLFLAKTDDGSSKVVLSRINLSDIVWGAMLPFESVIFEQGKTLCSEINPELFINGDESKIRQLVGILLDNACKYAEEKGTITVKLHENVERKIILSVNNSGVLIPPDQLEHIFERFFRVDKSRVREQGGYGLGLAIAQTIVKMHHAQISAQSTAESGTTISVAFPRGAY